MEDFNDKFYAYLTQSSYFPFKNMCKMWPDKICAKIIDQVESNQCLLLCSYESPMKWFPSVVIF